jgi:hypothetical protein
MSPLRQYVCATHQTLPQFNFGVASLTPQILGQPIKRSRIETLVSLPKLRIYTATYTYQLAVEMDGQKETNCVSILPLIPATFAMSVYYCRPRATRITFALRTDDGLWTLTTLAHPCSKVSSVC